MIQRIDHVAVAVPDIDAAKAFFVDVFNAVAGAGAQDPGMEYAWELFSLGDLSRLELLAPTGPNSFLTGFLEKHPAGGVHHITLQTHSISNAKQVLAEKNIPFFGEGGQGDHWQELFIHPRDAFGVLIQIAQFNADDWLSDAVKLDPEKQWRIEPAGDAFRLSVKHPGGGACSIRLSAQEMRCLANDMHNLLNQP